MPHPGLKVEEDPDFDGKLSGIRDVFQTALSDLMQCMLHPDRLATRKTPKKAFFRSISNFCENMYENGKLPDVKTAVEYAADVKVIDQLAESKQRYEDTMEKVLAKDDIIEEELLEQSHLAKREATKKFMDGITFGDAQYKAKKEKQFKKEVDAIFHKFKIHFEWKMDVASLPPEDYHTGLEKIHYELKQKALKKLKDSVKKMDPEREASEDVKILEKAIDRAFMLEKLRITHKQKIEDREFRLLQLKSQLSAKEVEACKQLHQHQDESVEECLKFPEGFAHIGFEKDQFSEMARAFFDLFNQILSKNNMGENQITSELRQELSSVVTTVFEVIHGRNEILEVQSTRRLAYDILEAKLSYTRMMQVLLSDGYVEPKTLKKHHDDFVKHYTKAPDDEAMKIERKRQHQDQLEQELTEIYKQIKLINDRNIRLLKGGLASSGIGVLGGGVAAAGIVAEGVAAVPLMVALGASGVGLFALGGAALAGVALGAASVVRRKRAKLLVLEIIQGLKKKMEDHVF